MYKDIAAASSLRLCLEGVKGIFEAESSVSEMNDGSSATTAARFLADDASGTERPDVGVVGETTNLWLVEVADPSSKSTYQPAEK